jgi:hypothetical protein
MTSTSLRRDGDEAVWSADNRDPMLPSAKGFGEARLQSIGPCVGRHRNDVRAVARNLLREQHRVVPGGERRHAEPVRMRIDDGERTLSDRARRTENRELLHATRPCKTMK